MAKTIEQREWKHAPRPGATDYRGENRWVVLDDGMVTDHFATEGEAIAAASELSFERWVAAHNDILSGWNILHAAVTELTPEDPILDELDALWERLRDRHIRSGWNDFPRYSSDQKVLTSTRTTPGTNSGGMQ